LCSVRSKKKFAAEKLWKTHFFINQEREKLINDYMARETAVATQRVQDGAAAMMQEQEHMGNVEMGQLTTTKPEISFEEMLNAIGNSVSNLTSSKDEGDGEDEDDNEEDKGDGKLSEDDEYGWEMGTISKTVQHRMKSFWQEQLKYDEQTQLGWGDAAEFFRERAMTYGMTELKIPADGKLQTDSTAATPSPTTFGEGTQTLDIVPRQ
jgi:hypothetical protein